MDNASKLYKFVADRPEFFEGGHDVHTPKGLVEEIFSKIELENRTVLVLFNIEFVISLVYTYGVSPENITFYSDHDNKTLMAERFGVKYCTSLDNLMKFDVVVGNPPYDQTTEDSRQREFYQQFVYQAHELAGHVGMVFPARWTSVNNATYKKFSNFLLDANMTHFKWLPGNTFSGVQMLTCYVITNQTNPYSGTIVEDRNGTQGTINLKQLGYYPSDLTTVGLLSKISNGTNIAYRAASGSLYENKLTKGTNKIVFRAGRTNDPIPYYFGSKASLDQTALFGNHKVVLSRNGAERKLGPVKVCDRDAGVGFACFGLKTQNDQQSQHLCNYLQTKVVKFLVDQYKRGTKGNSKELFSKIPDVDLNQQWDDHSVYALFNLTDIERKFIDDNY